MVAAVPTPSMLRIWIGKNEVGHTNEKQARINTESSEIDSLLIINVHLGVNVVLEQNGACFVDPRNVQTSSRKDWLQAVVFNEGLFQANGLH